MHFFNNMSQRHYISKGPFEKYHPLKVCSLLCFTFFFSSASLVSHTKILRFLVHRKCMCFCLFDCLVTVEQTTSSLGRSKKVSKSHQFAQASSSTLNVFHTSQPIFDDMENDEDYNVSHLGTFSAFYQLVMYAQTKSLCR